MKKGITAAILTLLFFVLFSCSSSSEVFVLDSEFEWVLVWEDDFSGDSIDESRWNFIQGAGGYGNNELQNYTSRTENARLEKGRLIIEAREENYGGSPYTSAKLTSAGKGEWTYGRYEFRAKLPEGQGIWPAVWMMPADMDVYGGWPSCGEIDIMELVGHEADTVHGTLHYGMPWKYTGDSYSLDGEKFSEDFHIFTLIWLPGEMRWYVDGYLFQTQTDWYSQLNSPEAPFTFNAPFDRDFYLQLNVAVGGNWPGYPDETTSFPQRMEIDWIRVYESSSAYPEAPVKKPVEEETITGREPQSDGNYVYNDSFSDRDAFWEFGNYEGGSGSASVESGEMKIAISRAGGQIWANQLIQQEMFLEQGRSYTVSFEARASEPRELMVKMGGLGDRGWAAYSGEQYISIDTEMKSYTFDFTMEEKSDPKARYEFNMGLHDADVWIDNAVLRLKNGEELTISDFFARRALKSGNYIYNGTFDQGYDRMAFWKIKNDSTSDAFLSVKPGLYEREGHLSLLESSGEMLGIRLYQDEIPFEQGTYRLAFSAYARGERKLYAALLDGMGNILSGPNSVMLSTELDQYQMDFQVDGNVENGTVAFLPAISGVKRDPDIIFDNVSFVSLSP